jgi:excisionase family DNA binding protein
MVDGVELLSVAAALRLLPIGRSTLYALIQDGQIPALRIGAAGSRHKRILIDRRDLLSFIESARHARPQTPGRVDVDGILNNLRGGARKTG